LQCKDEITAAPSLVSEDSSEFLVSFLL